MDLFVYLARLGTQAPAVLALRLSEHQATGRKTREKRRWSRAIGDENG